MASNSGSRCELLLDAGGVLSIIGGVVEVIGGGIVLGIVGRIVIGGPLPVVPHISCMPDLEIQLVFFPGRVIIVGILILVLGAIGIAGGILALKRKSYGLSLAGAICTIPTVVCGIVAITFVALSKRELRVEAKENDMTGRSWLLTAGGILSIMGGGVEVIGALVLGILVSDWGFFSVPIVVIVGVLLCLGLLSILGGILALRRNGYKWSLAGAVCALPTVIFGILAIWFISGRECEFEVED